MNIEDDTKCGVTWTQTHPDHPDQGLHWTAQLGDYRLDIALIIRVGGGHLEPVTWTVQRDGCEVACGHVVRERKGVNDPSCGIAKQRAEAVARSLGAGEKMETPLRGDHGVHIEIGRLRGDLERLTVALEGYMSDPGPLYLSHLHHRAVALSGRSRMVADQTRALCERLT